MCGRWIGGKRWICVGDGYVGRDGYVWEMDRWEEMDMCGRCAVYANTCHLMPHPLPAVTYMDMMISAYNYYTNRYMDK